MRSIYDHWTKTEHKADGFAGANTPKGFVSSYDTIADERAMERVYIIKGGSGTGKSTMMKKIASSAEKHGQTCRYYLCGSDPDSLDCVVLDDRIAILDGTSPHVRDMNLPGASSAIVDVSRFWDSNAIELHRQELAERAAMKSAAYGSCYRWMSAADAVHRECLALAETVFDREKARGYLNRLLNKLGKGPSGASSRLWSHAVTMKGRYRIQCPRATRLFTVNDFNGCAPLFLGLLDQMLNEYQFPHLTACLPLTDTLSAVYLDWADTAVTVGGEEGTAVNIKRFVTQPVSSQTRGRIRLCEDVAQSCLDAAADSLTDAAKEHFAMEEIYKPAVDFRALGRYTDSLVKEILGRLC